MKHLRRECAEYFAFGMWAVLFFPPISIAADAFYQSLPDIEGPFIDTPVSLPSLPDDFRDFYVLKNSGNQLALFPYRVDLVGQPDPIIRIVFNSFSVFKGDEPAGHLSLAAHVTNSRIPQDLRNYLSSHFPGSIIGKPKPSFLIKGDLIAGDGVTNVEARTLGGNAPSLTDIITIEADLNRFLVRAAVAGSAGDLLGIRIFFNLDVINNGTTTTKEYTVGSSFPINCSWNRLKFLDVSTMKFGCPDAAKFSGANLTQFTQRAQECAGQMLEKLKATGGFSEFTTPFLSRYASEICAAQAFQN